MEDILELMIENQQKQELLKIIECNNKTEQFGLILSHDNAKLLMENRGDTLKENKRIEFGESIISQIIYEFCDSQYINQDNYMETLLELQEIFYLFKNESMDELTDTELLSFMKKQFEEICFGDLEYLKSTCLERLARAVRDGYETQMQKRLRDEYTLRENENEYHNLAEETRWQYELYKQRLEDTY